MQMYDVAVRKTNALHIKKEGYLSQTANLHNLKSNTMKNTLQI